MTVTTRTLALFWVLTDWPTLRGKPKKNRIIEPEKHLRTHSIKSGFLYDKRKTLYSNYGLRWSATIRKPSYPDSSRKQSSPAASLTTAVLQLHDFCYTFVISKYIINYNHITIPTLDSKEQQFYCLSNLWDGFRARLSFRFRIKL